MSTECDAAWTEFRESAFYARTSEFTRERAMHEAFSSGFGFGARSQVTKFVTPTSTDPISQEEQDKLFDYEGAPDEVVDFIYRTADPDMTLAEARAKIREMVQKDQDSRAGAEEAAVQILATIVEDSGFRSLLRAAGIDADSIKTRYPSQVASLQSKIVNILTD